MMTIQITMRPVSELRQNPRNARTHSSKQISQIAASIQAFRFNTPILVDETDTVVAGHGRLEAAKVLKVSHLPTIRIDHLTPAQKKAYAIADNRTAELAGWDESLLASELQQLSTMALDFELTDTGFEVGEIDLLLQGLEENEAGEDEAIPEDCGGPPVSRPGDLWLVGQHRIYCGNALETESYAALMDGQEADMVFADPPYNVPIAGHVSGLGKARHREFAMAAGEMSEAEFTHFLTETFRQMMTFSKPGSVHFVCMDWRHLFELLSAGRATAAELINMCVWAKASGGMGSLYRSQHELIAVFKNGLSSHINNVQLGRFGRNRTNVWNYAGMNSFQADRDEKLAMHPTVKPVQLVADAMLDCSRRGSIVLDPFAGSGTTLLAAHRTGRRCFAMELDPAYVDVTLRRALRTHGLDALHSASGEPFSSREANTARAD
jgi:DNA modification methylase